MSETREIPLTQGRVAIVSIEDYEYLMQRKWCAQSRGNKTKWYALRTTVEDGKKIMILMHRVILARTLGNGDFECVDHIDGDGLNNQRGNLRSVTHKQNMENRRGSTRNSKSGIRGVHWHKANKKWGAEIRHNGKTIYLGTFDDIQEAEQAVVAGRNEYFTHHTG